MSICRLVVELGHVIRQYHFIVDRQWRQLNYGCQLLELCGHCSNLLFTVIRWDSAVIYRCLSQRMGTLRSNSMTQLDDPTAQRSRIRDNLITPVPNAQFAIVQCCILFGNVYVVSTK